MHEKMAVKINFKAFRLSASIRRA